MDLLDSTRATFHPNMIHSRDAASSSLGAVIVIAETQTGGSKAALLDNKDEEGWDMC